MVKYIVAFLAILVVAFAAPQPGVVAPLAYTAGYSTGYVAPAAYSAHFSGPVAAAYAAPAYPAYSAYNPVAYSSYVY